jgi:hypothetical protein
MAPGEVVDLTVSQITGIDDVVVNAAAKRQ